MALAVRGASLLRPSRVVSRTIVSINGAQANGEPVYVGGHKYSCSSAEPAALGGTEISHDRMNWWPDPSWAANTVVLGTRSPRWVRPFVASDVTAPRTWNFAFVVWPHTLKQVLIYRRITSAVAATVVGAPIYVAGHPFNIQAGPIVNVAVNFEGSLDGVNWSTAGGAWSVNQPNHLAPSDSVAGSMRPVRWLRPTTAADPGGPNTVDLTVSIFKVSEKES